MSRAAGSPAPPPSSQARVAASKAAKPGGSFASAAATDPPTIALRASIEASSTASGEPNSASRRRADSRPTPGVSTRRSQAASSSRSIIEAARVRAAQDRDGRARVAAMPLRSRLREAVAGRDRLLHVEDERVRHALEDPEHEQDAVPLVGQLDLRSVLVGRVHDDLA